MYELIQKFPVKFPDPVKHKIQMSDEVKDLINKVGSGFMTLFVKLLDKNAATRLGTSNGVDQIKEHEWFKDIDFTKLENRELEPPFVPDVSEDKFDVTNFDTQFTNEDAVNSVMPDSKLKMVQQFSKDFQDFNK